MPKEYLHTVCFPLFYSKKCYSITFYFNILLYFVQFPSNLSPFLYVYLCLPLSFIPFDLSRSLSLSHSVFLSLSLFLSLYIITCLIFSLAPSLTNSNAYTKILKIQTHTYKHIRTCACLRTHRHIHTHTCKIMSQLYVYSIHFLLPFNHMPLVISQKSF